MGEYQLSWIPLYEYAVLTALQGAWDQYIQGTGGNAMLDPSLQVWPMNVDMSNGQPLDPNLQSGQQPQQQQHAQQTAQGAPATSPGGVFMGATTPNMTG